MPRFDTARDLIAHLELGLKTLGVDDAPIILWDGNGNTTAIYSHGISPFPQGKLGFIQDDEFPFEATIHLAPFSDEPGKQDWGHPAL